MAGSAQTTGASVSASDNSGVKARFSAAENVVDPFVRAAQEGPASIAGTSGSTVDADSDKNDKKSDSNTKPQDSLKVPEDEIDTSNDEFSVETSPLLTITPASVSSALMKSYPYLIAADKVLAILTWTNDDIWVNIAWLCVLIFSVLYWSFIVKYLGHLLALVWLAWYTVFIKSIRKYQRANPTLDAAVKVLNSVSARMDMLISPVSLLALTEEDLRRLLFTLLFLTPFFLVVSLLFLSPKSLVLISVVYVYTYHSEWARVARAVTWRSRYIRLLTFYVTGLDFTGVGNKLRQPTESTPISNFTSQLLNSSSVAIKKAMSSNKPVRFTYSIYENQRRWLGIGWTSNLLSYERGPWTDEFLNEVPPPDMFKLPDVEGSGMKWRWIDRTWKLDLTNDGTLVLQNSKASKYTANPNKDDGYVYYDNTWKKPSSEDTFSKYTRRRRWVRAAELVPLSTINEKEPDEDDLEGGNPVVSKNESGRGATLADMYANEINKAFSSSPEETKQKSLRFSDEIKRD